jgi:hypothetical protein
LALSGFDPHLIGEKKREVHQAKRESRLGKLGSVGRH